MKRFFALLILLTGCEKSLVSDANDPITANCETFSPGKFQKLDSLEIKIRFASVPSSVEITIPKVKYNKEAIFNMEWDDNTRNALTGFNTMGIFSYTDGASKLLPFTGTVGVNAYTFNGDEIGCMGNDIKYSEYNKLIQGRWDIANHSNRHVDIGDPSIDIGSYSQDLNLLNDLYFNNMGYTINNFIVPANFHGFVPTVENLGFLSSSSTGHNTYKKKHPAFGQIGNIDSFDTQFLQLNRDFKDQWNSTTLADVKGKIDQLIANSDSNTHLFYRIGTHDIDSASLYNLCSYISSNSANKIWVTSAREWMEYRYIKENVVIEQSLQGNELIVKIYYTGIPEHIRFGDITLNIDAQGIPISSAILSHNGDAATFNSNTVNVYWDTPYKSQRAL